MPVIFENVAASDLTPAQIKLVGSEQGRLLRFKNAILARAEQNRNRDRITQANIAELAETLPLTALDLEHRPQEIVGFFTDARSIQDTIDQNGQPVATTALSTDGVIFADRFPEVARDVVSGKAQLSIEADAERAKCSVCAKEFTPADAYCEHLSSMAAKRTYAAERSFTKMIAAGGGVTLNPAGTETRFDHNRVQFVASVVAEPSAILALTAEGSEDAEKAERAARAAQRLLANFVGDAAWTESRAMPGAAHLNLYRPVLSPLTFVQNPEFIAEIVSKVKESMAAELAAASATLKPVPEPAPMAPAVESAREQVKQVVAEKLGESDKNSIRRVQSDEERTKEGTTEPEAVIAASEQPQVASVGLVGFAWDTPTKSHTSLKAVWE